MPEKLVLDKVCTCGNRMQIIARKENGYAEFECLENPNLSCYIASYKTVSCFACHRHHRFDSDALRLEMRLDSWPA